jgi:hypothetical protein
MSACAPDDFGVAATIGSLEGTPCTIRLLADRTPAEIKALIAKLDEVCRQARELQKTLRLQMLDRSRRERVYERSGKLTRKKPPR